MKISEVDTKVIEAINAAKAQVAEITRRPTKDINVELRHGYDQTMSWEINVFEADYKVICSNAVDLALVVEDIRQKHAEHLAKCGSNVARVKNLAEKLGVKVEVLP